MRYVGSSISGLTEVTLGALVVFSLLLLVVEIQQTRVHVVSGELANWWC